MVLRYERVGMEMFIMVHTYIHALDIDGMENQNENATDGTENGNGTETLDKASYMEHCKRVLMNAHSQLVTMDTSGSGVARYTVGEHKWEAGQLPRRLGPKNLFSLFEDTEEEKEQAIYVTLKGNVCQWF